MKICVRVHDFGKNDIKTLAKLTKEYGFDGIQLAINKAISGQTALYGTLNDDLCNEIKTEFNNLNLDVAMVGSYFNPVHSNKEKVSNEILKFKEHLSYASKMGTLYIGTETGSYNDDKWTYNPKNHLPEAFDEVYKIFKNLANHAEDVGSYIAVEGAHGHTMHSPDRLYELIEKVNSDNVYVIVDTYNYLSIDNYKNHTQIFDRALELFKDKIVIFHLKDFVVEDDKLKQVGLGQGLMNYDYILPKIEESCSNAYLIFEGVMPNDMKSSLKFIKERLKG